MRKVGKMASPQEAEDFRRLLRGEGIDTGTPGGEGSLDIWVLREEQLSLAKECFSAFQEGRLSLPPRPKAPPKPSSFAQLQKRASHVAKDLPRLSSCILFLCIMVLLGELCGLPLGRSLLFSNGRGAPLGWDGSWRSLELWRLWTPLFWQRSPLALFFHVYWFRQFSFQVEEQLGRGRFLLFLGALLSVSHLLFAVLVHPWFSGLSGMLFGLLAFMWSQNRYAAGDYEIQPGVPGLFIFFHLMGWFLPLFFPYADNAIEAMGAFMGFLMGTWGHGAIFRRDLRGTGQAFWIVLVALSLFFGSFIMDILSLRG